MAGRLRVCSRALCVHYSCMCVSQRQNVLSDGSAIGKGWLCLFPVSREKYTPMPVDDGSQEDQTSP